MDSPFLHNFSLSRRASGLKAAFDPGQTGTVPDDSPTFQGGNAPATGDASSEIPSTACVPVFAAPADTDPLATAGGVDIAISVHDASGSGAGAADSGSPDTSSLDVQNVPPPNVEGTQATE